MLIIGNDVVTEILTMDDCLRAQEEAFRKLPTGGAIHRPRIDMYFPCDREDGYFRWGTMEGANDGYFAIRMKSDIITWPATPDGGWTEDKWCREPGTYCGVILVMAAFVPKLAALLSLVPAPVVGAALCVALGGQVGVGIATVASQKLASRDYFVVGIPLLLGSLVGFLPPHLFDTLPGSLQAFLANSLIMGIVLVLLLEHLLLRKPPVSVVS